MKQVTVGGNRIGSGKKLKQDLKAYERSTHDIGFVWRSSASAGTLIPCLNIIGLPGTTIDLGVALDIKTHPTVGPLFGSLKAQIDVFKIPTRLYNAKIHQNAINVGLNMAAIQFPLFKLEANRLSGLTNSSTSQVGTSSIFRYLGISGLGVTQSGTEFVSRYFNAVPLLGYWEIFKHYYANKQEELAYVIHTEVVAITKNVSAVALTWTGGGPLTIPQGNGPVIGPGNVPGLQVVFTTGNPPTANSGLGMYINRSTGIRPIEDIWGNIVRGTTTVTCTQPKIAINQIQGWQYIEGGEPVDTEPQLTSFPLANIDTMRNNLMKQVDLAGPVLLARTGGTFPLIAPYSLALQGIPAAGNVSILTSKQFSQEGLAVKTYQSDFFNNWLNKNFIDDFGPGSDSIANITAIDVSGGYFTMDQLNIAKKVYDLLNRILVSDGTYASYINVAYDTDWQTSSIIPTYEGGLSQELHFQEVVSNAAALDEQTTQPLGTLAGKGVMSDKHKGGNITIKCEEPCFIMAIFSLTPRLDYSQGNQWEMNLQNYDQLHKPALDAIGFQDLTTDLMAPWGTVNDSTGLVQTFMAVGKQPSWTQYTTAVNRTYGSFAERENEMFMTLNRDYSQDATGTVIADATTYIDPAKYNYIFAQLSRDAQNFWVQIGWNGTRRAKMSAKQMPRV